MKKFDEKNLDVLQNIEFGIIIVYRANPLLLDMDVKDAIDSLIRRYHAEEEERRPPEQRLGDLAQRVFVSVQNMCEWRLGRSSLPDETSMLQSPIPVSELVESLRKIQKSIGGGPAWVDARDTLISLSTTCFESLPFAFPLKNFPFLSIPRMSNRRSIGSNS